MEEKPSSNMDTKDPGKLDFTVPLISTRRPNSNLTLQLPGNSHRDTHIKVPFSWEQSPGKPKETDQTQNTFINNSVPPPRPPPGWTPPQEIDYDADNDDNFFDTIDTLSFSEAFDIMVERRNGLGGLNLESKGSESPSFIIQRFLSDAKALAASSGFDLSGKDYNDDDESEGVDFPRKWGARGVSMESGSNSPKGCGFDVLFPWKMKHKPCSAKSPVRVISSDVKPRRSRRDKKNS